MDFVYSYVEIAHNKVSMFYYDWPQLDTYM